MTTPMRNRLTAVRHRLSTFEAEVGRRNPAHAEAVRDSLSRLMERLHAIHERSAAVDERAWADYVADLDRALNELDVEIARAAEQPESQLSVERALLAHTSALELSCWRMRFTVPGSAAADALPRIEAAEGELSRYDKGGTSAPKEPLALAMTHVRRVAES